MAFSLNRAQIIGNTTRDPEVRTTPNGQKVTSFGVATNFTWKDQSGVKKEKTEFHNVVCWRGLAEIAEQYLKKGRKVFVEGRMQTREWEGEDGVKRFRTEIIADNLILLDRKGDAPGGGGTEGLSAEEPAVSYPREKGSVKKPKAEAAADQEEVSLDDLPF